MNDKEFIKRLGSPPSLKNAKKSFERDLFEAALRKASKSPVKAARLLGLKYQTFIRRLAKHEGLERTPIKTRYHALPTEDHYVVITRVGPNPLTVAKIISQYIPGQTNQEQLLQKLASHDEITFKAPSKGRTKHIVKLLKKHKAAATSESVPKPLANPKRSAASNSR